MEITAAAVKELRERSGAGMMECKKALVQNQGDMEASIDWLRTQGLAKADKKASRVAAEGRFAVALGDNEAVVVEVNCETDFVAKDANFVAFADAVAAAALNAHSGDVEVIKAQSLGEETVEQRRQALVAKIGENLQIRRASYAKAANLGVYLHSNARIAVLVNMQGGTAELAKSVAMHIAAMTPLYLDMDQVPADVFEREKQIALEQSKDSGKSAEILEKMVLGKIRKQLGDQTLVGQAFAAADADGKTVGEALKKAGATVLSFTRLSVGEGIEKKQEDFAAEVMAQVAASQLKS